jgi:hydrogenase nickel incorporation protein HypA/HybF
MHELSIAQGIVDIIRQYVPEHQTTEIRKVKLRLGPLAGIVADSLDFCFGAIIAGTELSQASLQIEATAIRSECGGCGVVFDVEGAVFSCPGCGGADIKIISGTELQVVEIELSDLQAGVV